MSTLDTLSTQPTDAPEELDTSGAAGAGGAVVPAGPDDKKRRRRIIAFILVLALILALAAIGAWYLLNRKPLTELPGLQTTKVPHYERSIYGVTTPLGVAVTPDGARIYVTEQGLDPKVTVFDKDGKKTGALTMPKTTEAEGMHQPVYVAINPTNLDVYVSDRLTSSIYIFNGSGTYLRTFAPSGDVGKWAPLALFFAPDGTLYVSDVRGNNATAHRIDVFGPDGALQRTLGKPGELNYPNGVWADAQGNAWVSDSNNGRVVTFDKTGAIVAEVSRGLGDGDLGMPRGIAQDDSSRLFVVDTTDHMVRVYTVGDKAAEAPTYVGSIGGEGRADATFEYPNGLAVDKRAHIYVTDRENNRVQVWGY